MSVDNEGWIDENILFSNPTGIFFQPTILISYRK